MGTLYPLDVSAGAGGQGGIAGQVGGGGLPGDSGATTGVFSASSDCPNPGPTPNWGPTGNTPVPGSYGNGVSGSPGSAQFFVTGP